MTRWEIESPGRAFAHKLELAAAELSLKSERTSLKSLGSNVHWHLSHPGRAGTLEATWLIDADQAWLCVRANRRADWIEPTVHALLALLDAGTMREIGTHG